MTVLLVLALLGGVPKGGTLYVKGAAVALRAQPNLKSKSVGRLKSGEAVVWLGPSNRDPEVQEITVRGKHGFVATTDLTPFAPEHDPGGSEGFKSATKFHATGYVECHYADPSQGSPGTPVDEQLDALRTSSMDQAGHAPQPIHEAKK